MLPSSVLTDFPLFQNEELKVLNADSSGSSDAQDLSSTCISPLRQDRVKCGLCFYVLGCCCEKFPF